MVIKAAVLLFVVVVLSSLCYGQQPCDSNAVNVEVDYNVVRTANNEVHLYARAWTSGTWRQYYIPWVSGHPSLNGSYTANEAQQSAQTWSGTAPVDWYYTISQTGVGNYKIDSKHWVRSPYCEQYGWTWYTYAYNRTTQILRPGRPDYAPGSPAPYYLGGTLASGSYSAQTTLNAGNPNGAIGTPTWSIVAGADSGSLSCSSCNQTVYTATKATPSCMSFNIVIKTSYGGLESDPFYIFNNSPAYIENSGIYIPSNPGWPEVGYETLHPLRAKNICGEVMNWVAVNESFTNRRYGAAWNGISNWDLSWAVSTWTGALFDADGWFIDTMWEYQRAGKEPNPMPSGSNNFDKSDASAVTIHDQWFKAGPLTSGSGVLLWGTNQIHYLDDAHN